MQFLSGYIRESLTCIKNSKTDSLSSIKDETEEKINRKDKLKKREKNYRRLQRVTFSMFSVWPAFELKRTACTMNGDNRIHKFLSVTIKQAGKLKDEQKMAVTHCRHGD